jgi:hypothetical protein
VSGILLLLGLAAVGVGGLLLVDRVRRDSVAGVVLVLAAFLLAEVGLDVSLQLGPFRVETRDVVMVTLLGAAVMRLLSARRVPGPVLAVAALLGVVLLSTVLGGAEHGIGAAVNEARKYLRFLTVALYVATIVPDDEEVRRRAGRWIVRTGWVVLGVAVVRWVSYFTGVPVPFTGVPPDLRVVDSFGTLLLLQALVIEAAGAATSLPGARSGPRLPEERVRHAWRLVALASGAVVLLQHRTLWAALLLAAVLLLARDPRASRRLLLRATAGAAIVGVLAFATLGQGDDRIVLDELEGSATQVATFEWRVEGWARLVEEHHPRDLQDWLLGAPFGGGFDRLVEGRVVTVSPHNYYLETFLRTWLTGLLLLLGMTAWVLNRTLRSRGGPADLRDDALGICVVVASLYYATSHAPMEQGVVFGLAVSATLSGAVSRRTGSRRKLGHRT